MSYTRRRQYRVTGPVEDGIVLKNKYKIEQRANHKITTKV